MTADEDRTLEPSHSEEWHSVVASDAIGPQPVHGNKTLRDGDSEDLRGQSQLQSLRSRLNDFWGSSGRSGALGLVDQGIVSAVRFATTILIGRFCGAGELGTYALAVSVMVMFQNVQDSMVLGPFVVFGSRMEVGRRSRYAGSVLCEAAIFVMLAVLAIAGLTALLYTSAAEQSLWRTFAVLGVVIPFILLHQFSRRFAFADLDIGTAILMDVSAAVVQLGGVAYLALAGSLSAAASFVIIGVAFAVPAAVWLLRFRRTFAVHWSGFGEDMRLNWGIGRWMLASQLTSTVGTYVGSWLLALLLSVKAAGLYAACASIVCLTNPILLGLSNVLIPRTARAFGRGGYDELRRVTRESLFLLTGLTGIAGVILIVFGEMFLTLLYGTDFASGQLVITILTVATFLNSICMSDRSRSPGAGAN